MCVSAEHMQLYYKGGKAMPGEEVGKGKGLAHQRVQSSEQGGVDKKLSSRGRW